MNQHFQFRPSPYLAAALGLGHGAVLAALPLLALPAWAVAALSLAICSSLAYHWLRDAWLRLPDSCTEASFGDEALLTLRSGKQLRGRLADDALVTPYLTVLTITLDDPRGARSLVVLPDSLDAEAFRQLRLGLKWGNQSAR